MTIWMFFLWVCPTSEFFGRTQSLCHVSPPSPSFPLCIYSSPPIRVLAVCGARRKAWTWRCLGSITRDDTVNATASCRRKAALWSWAGLTFNFWSGKHFFRSLLKTFFLSFPIGGLDSDLLFAAAAVGLDDFSYPRATVTLEEWEPYKQLGEEANSTEQPFIF